MNEVSQPRQRPVGKMPGARPRGARAGFTLAEVIVALLIGGLLLSMLTVSYVRVLRGIRETNRVARPLRIGPALLDLVAKDLQATYVYGYERDYFEGEDEGQLDKLKFISSMNSRLKYKGRPSDVTEVGYFTQPNDIGFNTLYRREDFFLDQKPLLGGKKQKLYDRVVEFDIKYYKKPEEEADRYDLFSEEQDYWKADDEEALPIAVKIRLVVQPTGDEFDEERQHAFETVVALPDYGTIQNPFKDLPEEEVPDEEAAAAAGAAAGQGGAPQVPAGGVPAGPGGGAPTVPGGAR